MSGKRLVAIIAAVAGFTGLGGVLAGVAVANHQWNDVATGTFFHEDIDNFTNAGCASGYPGNQFRPTEPVLRQQMARFVNACGGRIEFDSGAVVAGDEPAPIISNLNMVAGAVGDGAGIVQVVAAVHADSSSDSGFPCEIRFNFSGITGEEVYLDLDDTADGVEDANATIMASFTIAAGFNSNLFLMVDKFGAGCTANVNTRAEASMTYFPFNSDGSGGAETAPTSETEAEPPRIEPGD